QHRNGFHLAAGLNHQIAAAPVSIGNGLVGRDLNAFAVDQDALALTARLAIPAAMHRIEIDQMGVGCGVTGRVVDLHKLKFRPAPGGAQRQTTDTTKSVDTYLDSHKRIPSTK